MVEDANTDAAVKVRLMDDLSFFQENVAVTKQCMQLGRTLLRKNSDQRIAVAVVGALTQLAKRNGLAWSEQISLVLDEIDALGENMTLLRCYFANLLELSESPQNWSDAQVEASKLKKNTARFCSYQSFSGYVHAKSLLLMHEMRRQLFYGYNAQKRFHNIYKRRRSLVSFFKSLALYFHDDSFIYRCCSRLFHLFAKSKRHRTTRVSQAYVCAAQKATKSTS